MASPLDTFPSRARSGGGWGLALARSWETIGESPEEHGGVRAGSPPAASLGIGVRCPECREEHAPCSKCRGFMPTACPTRYPANGGICGLCRYDMARAAGGKEGA